MNKILLSNIKISGTGALFPFLNHQLRTNLYIALLDGVHLENGPLANNSATCGQID